MLDLGFVFNKAGFHSSASCVLQPRQLGTEASSVHSCSCPGTFLPPSAPKEQRPSFLTLCNMAGHKYAHSTSEYALEKQIKRFVLAASEPTASAQLNASSKPTKHCNSKLKRLSGSMYIAKFITTTCLQFCSLSSHCWGRAAS